MFENFRSVIVPHLIGLCLIFIGWFISIAKMKIMLLDYAHNDLFSPVTIIGLILIVIGAYLPDIWRKKAQ